VADKNTAPTKEETPTSVTDETQNVQPEAKAEVEVEDVIDESIEQINQEEQETQETSEEDSELATALAQAQANKEGWQRTLAEFQNYKRRVEREQTEARTRIALDTLTKILPVIDDFERALGNVPDSLANDPFVNGVSLIQGKFNKLLEEYDVEVVDPAGEEFDPNHHQAISMEDSDEHDSGIVIETLQKGYISGNTLLRPAMVRVAN